VRDVPYDINERLKNRIQTKATNADPRLSFWISRKTTQLTDSVFLESADVAEGTITDCSIAVRHMKFGFDSDRIYIAYIQNGMAKVASSPVYAEISRHTWTDCGFMQTAEAVAVAFDGTMPKDTHGRYEFITEAVPWVFWISSGAVYGQKLGGSKVLLAAQNATDISAVRAMWSDVPGFDFGLVLFMVINGAIHYRQLIGGVWSDAEPVPASVLPTEKVWTQISAKRTWDYRVALQLMASDGTLYEVFSQFEGIGSKNAEHIAVKAATAQSAMTAVHYTGTYNNDSIEVSDVSAASEMLSTVSAVPVSCRNIDDGTGNWGVSIVAEFSHRLMSLGTGNGFYIQDANGNRYYASAAVSSDGGYTVTFTLSDFNAAEGQICTLHYTPGEIMSEAVPLESFAGFAFVPINLVAPHTPAPEVEGVWNE